MDIDKLSGLEFEKLIYNILIKIGFRANLTKSSGDGGIDIEAFYDGIFFKGKYVIQCKRWDSKVGEPVLRDLFGTMISNNALKGILITTNYFSKHAKDFCIGKNVELIDRDQLIELVKILNERETMTTPILSQDTVGFLGDSRFDKESYELLKFRIEDNQKLEKTHKALTLLLSNSIFEIGEDAMGNGLLEEFFARANTYLNQFCSGKTNETKGNKTCVTYLMAQACIAKGDLSQAYEYLLESNESYGFRDNWKMTLPGVEQFWDRAYYFIFDLIGLSNSKKELCESSVQNYKRNRSNLSEVEFDHPKRVYYEILLFEQGDLVEEEFQIPWVTNYTVDLGKYKDLDFEAKPITLAEYKKKFYNKNKNFESHKKIIQSYGVHS